MVKFKFSNIVDTAFISVVTFLIIFAWIQFFIKNLLLSIMVSAVLAIGIIFLIRWFKLRKYSSTQAKVNRNSNLELFKLAISTMSSTKLGSIIKKLLPNKYFPRTNKGDINFIKDNSTHSFTFYYSNELTEPKLLELIKTKPAQNLTIFCLNYTQEVKSIATAFKNKNITLVSIEQLFDIFNSKNIQVDTSHIDLTKHKITFKQMLKSATSRNKSKSYFTCGIILLLTSLIIPYKIYYVIFSSILFALSLLCRFKPTPKFNDSIFD